MIASYRLKEKLSHELTRINTKGKLLPLTNFVDRRTLPIPLAFLFVLICVHLWLILFPECYTFAANAVSDDA